MVGSTAQPLHYPCLHLLRMTKPACLQQGPKHTWLAAAEGSCRGPLHHSRQCACCFACPYLRHGGVLQAVLVLLVLCWILLQVLSMSTRDIDMLIRLWDKFKHGVDEQASC